MIEFEKRECSVEQSNSVLNWMADYCKAKSAEVSCFVLGGGGQPKSTYTKLSQMPGVSVRLVYNVLPPYLFFLRFIPSYAGVVEVLDAKPLCEIVDTMGDSGLMDIFVFGSGRNRQFIDLLKTRPNHVQLDEWFEKVDEGLRYTFESEQSIDWISMGENVPRALVEGLERVWKETRSSSS